MIPYGLHTFHVRRESEGNPAAYSRVGPMAYMFEFVPSKLNTCLYQSDNKLNSLDQCFEFICI